MRNDYFTLCELASVARAGSEKIKRIMLSENGFPYARCGLKYVIHKASFFRWYDAHKNDEELRYQFDDTAIEAAKNEYVLFRQDNRIKRRAAL